MADNEETGENQNQKLSLTEINPLSQVEQAVLQKIQSGKTRRKGRNLNEADGFTNTLLAVAFSVLLLFLLIIFTSDPLSIKQDAHLLLARSTTNVDPVDAMTITISKSYISADQKNIVNVECRFNDGTMCSDQDFDDRVLCDFHPEDCSPEKRKMLDSMYFYVDRSWKENGDENSFLIVPLLKVLKDKVRSEKDENDTLGREFKGNLNLIVDRDIPFRLIAEAVYTAGLAGLSNVNFAIIKTF
jgi:hypothetical protein